MDDAFTNRYTGTSSRTVTNRRRNRLIVWAIAAAMVISLAVGGFWFWQSLRTGIVDEPIEKGMSRAEAFGNSLMEKLQGLGFTLDSETLVDQGKIGCGGDVTSLGSSYVTFLGGSHGTIRRTNQEIVESIALDDLPGWRDTGDMTDNDMKNGGETRQLYFTNDDLSVRLTIVGEPQTGQPFVSFSVSTSCYNNGASNIRVGDFGPSGVKPTQ